MRRAWISAALACLVLGQVGCGATGTPPGPGESTADATADGAPADGAAGTSAEASASEDGPGTADADASLDGTDDSGEADRSNVADAGPEPSDATMEDSPGNGDAAPDGDSGDGDAAPDGSPGDAAVACSKDIDCTVPGVYAWTGPWTDCPLGLGTATPCGISYCASPNDPPCANVVPAELYAPGDPVCGGRPVCQAGRCAVVMPPAGSIAANQNRQSNICGVAVCDGKGGWVLQPDFNNVTLDPCVNWTCQYVGLAPENLPPPNWPGTYCGANAGSSDAGPTCHNGQCTGCTADSDCAARTSCTVPHCMSGVCSETIAPRGASCTMVGDAGSGVCNGAGTCVDAALVPPIP